MLQAGEQPTLVDRSATDCWRSKSGQHHVITKIILSIFSKFNVILFNSIFPYFQSVGELPVCHELRRPKPGGDGHDAVCRVPGQGQLSGGQWWSSQLWEQRHGQVGAVWGRVLGGQVCLGRQVQHSALKICASAIKIISLIANFLLILQNFLEFIREQQNT